MHIIDTEAHFYTEMYMKELSNYPLYPHFRTDAKGNTILHFHENLTLNFKQNLIRKLLKIDHRLKNMQDAGVSVQVLSLSVPGCELLEPSIGTRISKLVNDELARIIDKYPENFTGLASIAPQDPDKAAEEFERAVNELGLRGIKLHSNIGGKYPDAPEFQFIFEIADKLKVPIYIHPTQSKISALQGYGYGLAGPAFGYTFDAALSALRIILSGLLDKYPGVNIVLGHLGETLPFIIKRINFAYTHTWHSMNIPRLSKPPSEYLTTNFYLGTAGNFHQPALKCAYDTFGPNHLLFASDYPYENIKMSVAYIKRSSIPLQDQEKIFYHNPKRVFCLKNV
jgi:predicted TIM-barrel fold metal-dependent hydrolase